MLHDAVYIVPVSRWRAVSWLWSVMDSITEDETCQRPSVELFVTTQRETRHQPAYGWAQAKKGGVTREVVAARLWGSRHSVVG